MNVMHITFKLFLGKNFIPTLNKEVGHGVGAEGVRHRVAAVLQHPAVNDHLRA